MKLSRKLLAFLLLLVALVLINYLGSHYSTRLDLTANRTFTVSDGTKALLEKIEEPLSLTFYFSRSVGGGDDPTVLSLKNYATRVEEMLRQYTSIAGPSLSLSVIDPRPDTDDEAEARRAGLTPHPLATGDQIFFGLAAAQGAEEDVISFMLPNRENFLEYDISRLIYNVQRFDKPRLGLISGLPLQAQPMQFPGQQPAPDQIVIQEWQNTYEIVGIEETAETLPESIDVLAIVHPRNLSESLQYSIDQFLLSGRPVFLAVDPSSYYNRRMQQQQQNGMMFGGPQEGVSSDLPRLLDAWGITFDPASVVGDLELASNVQTAQGIAPNATWLSLREEQFNASSPPSSSLGSMLMLDAGTIEVAEDRGYDVTPLARTSSRSSNIQGMLLQFTPPEQLARQVKPEGTPKNLAVLVHGTFRTAFPDGKPAPEPATTNATGENGAAEESEPAAASPEEPTLLESTSPGTVIVVGDTDWLLDIASVRRIPLLNAYSPLNDNLAFASNTLDFLGGSEDLIAIRGKASTQRDFEVIREMEIAAQEKFQAEQEELQQRQSELQQRISDLVSQQAQGGTLIASPEVEDAIANFREEEAEVRVALRDIRRALREGVERLQNGIIVVVLATIPLLEIAAGLIFIFRRHNRKNLARGS